MKSIFLASSVLFLSAAALPAAALEPAALFEKVSPSVWIVRTYDAGERPVMQGSAVVIGKGKLVTNCHVLAQAKTVAVRRRNVTYEATLEHADTPRDLCLLNVEGFQAPAVAIGAASELKIGQKVYAIGNPKGLEVTLSEGLVSGLRGEWPDGSHVVQTSAAISSGSSGGGLFDAEGRLVGITTLYARDAQNLNFALPAEWIAQVPERAQAALAKRAAPKTAGSAAAPGVPAGYPAPGTVWVYRFTDRFSGRAAEVTVRADRVDPEFIEETVIRKGASSGTGRRTVQTREARFVEFGMGSDSVLLELAPYLVTANDGKAPPVVSALGYPAPEGDMRSGWIMNTVAGGWDEVSVPAGRYRALRYQVLGKRDRSPIVASRSYTLRFQVTVWYAPDVQRIVKLEHQTFGTAPGPHGDDVLELIQYRPPS